MLLRIVLLTIVLLSTQTVYAAPGSAPENVNMKGPIFERVVFIGAPASKVWSAIVNSEIVNQYYLAPLVKLELKVGGKIYYGSDTQHLIDGEVLEVVEGQKLVHSFKFTDSSDSPSRVTYEIQPMGEMCALTLRHDNFPTANQTFSDISGGWDVILSSLKTLIETGHSLPWPKPNKAK